LDHELGRLFECFDEVGLLDNSWLIITADHGNDTREHNSFGHREVYEECVRVPLIMRPAKALSGGPRRIEGLAEHTDLMPTILDLANLECERPTTDGRSLRDALGGGGRIDRESSVATGCYIQHGGLWKSCELAMRTPQWKYVERGAIPEQTYDETDLIGMIVSARGATPHERLQAFRELPRRELYDLQEDPEELINLIEQRPDVADDLANCLDGRRGSQWFV